MRLVPGLYDLPLTNELQERIARSEASLRAETAGLDGAGSNGFLARHVANIVREILGTLSEGVRLTTRQAEVCNELLASLGRSTDLDPGPDSLVVPPQRLVAVFAPTAFRTGPPASPDIPLSQSDLLVNARGEPRINRLLLSEIESADRIDLLVAFIRWSGLRLFEEQLRAFVESGKPLRVITTTYTGSTERRAIERLVEIGAEVRVSYLTDNTRLHAKAWMFHRDSGFSTAYIGSSNLTMTAQVEGLEWNVRLSQTDAPAIVEKFHATFETYWADPDFERYDGSAEHRARFDHAVAAARDEGPAPLAMFDIQPWPHQREILERLHVERYRHARWRNLVVAATGTGKTVVAALDYRRLTEDFGRRLRLLFVAHRREILQQSLGTFRTVMRDGSFGELYVDGHRPTEGSQVFASIQSLGNVDLATIAPDHFDVVIVDEFHHAAAPSYERLLSHLQPRVLLGLTATPERSDGKSVLDHFDGRYAVELRLWDALERGLLSPFHYFGLHDGVDLANARWVRGGYDAGDLETLYTGNDARLTLILKAIDAKVSDRRSMRALGFCVGVAHAEYMARRFNEAGIPAAFVVGETASSDRDAALRRLRAGEINALFAVDVFNEGVDLPEIDTVLFLRPTESATIFLQQLGRGLRRATGKAVLTVLDFIGNAHRNFRFDLRYRALAGGTRREVEEQIEQGFPLLPAGCAIQLDREASRIVLENLRQAIGNRFASLVGELRSMGEATSLAGFLEATRLDVEDVYRTRGWSWTRLRREAFPVPVVSRIADGAPTTAAVENDETRLLSAISRLLHTDDSRRSALVQELFGRATPPAIGSLAPAAKRVLEGLLITLFARDERDADAALARIWASPGFLAEVRAVLEILDDRAEHETPPLSELLGTSWTDVPLALHARYSLDEVTSSIGRATLAKPLRLQSGVLRDDATNADYLFVTLEKSEKHYSPTTRYRDYAISPTEFHWESQSVTREESETGQRYIHHARRGSHVFLFIRQTRKLEGARAGAYTFLGPASYVRHSGEKPMAIVWRLHQAMPLDFFRTARVAAG